MALGNEFATTRYCVEEFRFRPSVNPKKSSPALLSECTYQREASIFALVGIQQYIFVLKGKKRSESVSDTAMPSVPSLFLFPERNRNPRKFLLWQPSGSFTMVWTCLGRRISNTISKEKLMSKQYFVLDPDYYTTMLSRWHVVTHLYLVAYAWSPF